MNKKTSDLTGLSDRLSDLEEELSDLRNQTVFGDDIKDEATIQDIQRRCSLLARSALELGIATYTPLRLIASEKKLRESK